MSRIVAMIHRQENIAKKMTVGWVKYVGSGGEVFYSIDEMLSLVLWGHSLPMGRYGLTERFI